MPEPLKPGASLPPDVVALNLVMSTGAVLYLDPAGEPRIRRASDGTDDIPWPLRSRVTEGWLAKLYFEYSHRLLGRSEIDRILLCLEGKAADNPHVNIELCDAIESEPVLGLIIHVMQHEQYLKLTADDLLRRLRDSVKDRPYLLTSPRWPKNAESLGRRLRTFSSWLQKANVVITFERDGRNRWIILSASTRSKNTEPSPQPSHSNLLLQGDFQQGDGSDRAIVATPEVEFDRLMKEMIV